MLISHYNKLKYFTTDSVMENSNYSRFNAYEDSNII